VAEGVKNINPKHKEYVMYGESQLRRVQKTAGACGPRCTRGHRPMCRRLVVLGARVSLSWLITGVLWYLWLDVVFFVSLGCVCRICSQYNPIRMRVGVWHGWDALALNVVLDTGVRAQCRLYLLCVERCSFQRRPFVCVPPDRHTSQSPTQTDIFQMMYWYN
jgi:hypothetical protein